MPGLSAIPTARVLANVSGIDALPSATALTQPAAGLTIAAGSSAFTFALANDLAALEGLGSTGLAVRTTADTWALRSVAGTADRVAVANGDGVLGNPTVDIDAAYVGQTSITTLGTIGAGTWNAGTVSSATNSVGARPASTLTAGWALTSNYAGVGEVDLWSTVNGVGNNQGFYFYQKLSASTEQLLLVASGTASSTEIDIHSGSIIGFLYADSVEVGAGSTSNVPYKLYSNNIVRLSLPTTGGLAVTGITSGSLTLQVPAVAGTNTLTFPAGTTDFSATGGASQVVMQASAGGAFTVAQLAASDLSNGTTGTLAVVLATSPSIASPTLTGTVTLTGSGTVTSSGELGLGGSPISRLELTGTYTTANSALMRIAGTHASSLTSTQRILNMQPTLAPSGASLSTIDTALFSPTLNSTAFTITTWNNVSSGLTLGASFSGVITTYNGLIVTTPTINGGSITNLNALRVNPITNGDGATSGTVTNRGLSIAAISAGAAGGTLNNTSAIVVVPTGGATSGTANNRGIWINGNGGVAAGGTVNNFALFSDSTAPFQIGGMFFFLGSTSAFPALKRSSAELQVRVADDSADGALKSLKITTSSTTFMHETSAALANGAAAAAGTLLNAPAAGNPTKWIPINDNGTTRYIPAW